MEGEHPAGTPASVLVVDDEPEIVDIVTVVLDHAGYHVLGAATGEEALRLAREQRPALILLDIMLPGMSGWEVLQALKADADLRDVPVMMLTALAQDADILRGLQAGAVEYLVKPFDLVGLTGHVEWLLKRSSPADRESHRRQLVDKLRLAA